MKGFRFLFFVVFSVFISDISAGFIGKGIFIDVGAFVGGFKGKEKSDCPDIGFIGVPEDILYAGDASAGFLHVCSSDCVVVTKTKTKMTVGGTVGIYVPIDENYSLGIEGFSEWHDVQYDENNCAFMCTDENCVKQTNVDAYKYDDKGVLVDGDSSGRGDKFCKKFAPSARICECFPVVKSLRHHQYGAMVAMKFYTAGSESYVKLAGGVGQLSMKNPVAIGHREGEGEPNNELDAHKYEIKKVKCRKGIAWEAAIGTRITRNLYMGLNYMGQRNVTKDKSVTYTNNRIMLSLSIDFGH